MNSWILKTPVVFIVFNRPEQTWLVFQEITKARPKKLMVICDGPRAGVVGEAEKVSQVRNIISSIDWECELVTNFSEENLGCKVRVSTGLDWVFNQVEEAIILEDDCIPDPSFFQFCHEMLDLYREDKRVGMISGDNFHSIQRPYSYYFSKYFHIWGWATWRDRWAFNYDVDMKTWPLLKNSTELLSLMGSPSSQKFWTKTFQKVFSGEIDTWDYQWVYANWISKRVSIMPSQNLITNIGFGADATHTKNKSPLANLPRYSLQFPLQHPKDIEPDKESEMLTEKSQFKNSLLSKIINKFFNGIALRIQDLK
jgi:hypothetical protein